MKKAIPEIISRLTIGYVFVESGWGKIHNLPKVVEFFQSLNIPLASLQAPFVSAVELTGGLLILTGLFTRITSLPLMAIMTVALATAKREDITDFSSLLAMPEFLYIVILVWLATHGSHYFSLGSLARRYFGDLACKPCKAEALSSK